MRARVKIMDLSLAQWDRAEERLRTSYEIEPGEATVCAVFEFGHPQGPERHVEMPVQEFATLMVELAMVRTTLGPDKPLPVLPTAAEARDLSATETASLSIYDWANCQSQGPTHARRAFPSADMSGVTMYHQISSIRMNDR